jgi:hypothetical protein
MAPSSDTPATPVANRTQRVHQMQRFIVALTRAPRYFSSAARLFRGSGGFGRRRSFVRIVRVPCKRAFPRSAREAQVTDARAEDAMQYRNPQRHQARRFCDRPSLANCASKT